MKVPETFPHCRVTSTQNVLLWDGECGFCARSVNWFQRHARKPVASQPVQDFISDLPAEVRATARQQVLWITSDGEVMGGSHAIVAALRAAGHPWQAAILQALQPFTGWVYRFIARHRAHLGSPACEPHPRG